ncbi:CIH_collapsed_G0045450.mRNA.1.CDS.1 [Saccharomyces cerevisiae]|nr:hypothetical protein H818_YJM1433N00121 [Saccharomyces cerevisiae YJM1433]CAI6670558.1 CIH_HP1_G0044370.mRNA.1.CDS.1 [Saccharomyces cerevisiae]CAI7443178.1 CIH_collapsed_G0045450.mRNA.1.CDS.1 [Saccharomyces cerevisiae]
MPPRSIEEWFYYKLLSSPGFHRFVRKVYRKVNGIKEDPFTDQSTAFQYLYKPTPRQKFKALRLLFWDEMRSTFGFRRRIGDRFKKD